MEDGKLEKLKTDLISSYENNKKQFNLNNYNIEEKCSPDIFKMDLDKKENTKNNFTKMDRLEGKDKNILNKKGDIINNINSK